MGGLSTSLYTLLSGPAKEAIVRFCRSIYLFHFLLFQSTFYLFQISDFKFQIEPISDRIYRINRITFLLLTFGLRAFRNKQVTVSEGFEMLISAKFEGRGGDFEEMERFKSKILSLSKGERGTPGCHREMSLY